MSDVDFWFIKGINRTKVLIFEKGLEYFKPMLIRASWYSQDIED
jgi:hypothetical protein